MSMYISEILDKLCDCCNGEGCDGERHGSKQECWTTYTLRDILRNIPTEEEVEVKRYGKWEDEHILTGTFLIKHDDDLVEHQCSKCKKWSVRLAKCIEDNYCPNCGARMDGAE